MADSITQGTLVSLQINLNEFVKQDQILANIETEKVTIPVNSSVSGTLIEKFAKEGDTVQVGADLCKIAEGQEQSKTVEPTKLTNNEPKKSTNNEPTNVEAKSEEKIITSTLTSNKQETPIKSQSMKIEGLGREEYRVPMSRIRSRIAERLKESQQTAASLTTFNEVDMSAIIDLRATFKEAIFNKHKIKFGFMSAFIKASSIALEEIPEINARIEGNEIVYSDFADISVAVATPKGLVTPVLRNCEKLSLIEIEQNLFELAEKAKDNKLKIEEMLGGTFTISNGGVFGSMMGTPIINLPQSAILGMHAIKDRPVAINGDVQIRPMMYLALTYDHRLIDGREAVSFLVRLKEILEDPRRMLLDI